MLINHLDSYSGCPNSILSEHFCPTYSISYENFVDSRETSSTKLQDEHKEWSPLFEKKKINMGNVHGLPQLTYVSDP